MTTIVDVIVQQPLTEEVINSFRSVPAGINLTASGDGTQYLSNDGTYKPVSGASGTNLSLANKTSTTLDVLSSTGTDVTLPAASTTEAGLLAASDKVQLTNLATNLAGKFNNPTGDTTQYVAGDGSLIAFPVAGQAGTLVRQVRNETGSTLIKGTIVYISGASGNKPLVTKALATSDATSAQTFGMLQADISTNSNGYAVVKGDLVGIDTSSFADGTQLYLSGSVAGTYTSTKPVAPIHMVYVGIVTRSHVTQGQIEVAIQNGYEMDELHDVLITSKTNKDIISYDTPSGLWKNKQLTLSDVTGADPTEIEVDFGTKPVRSKKFTITAAGVSGTSKIIVSSSGNVATGRVGDDWEWDSISTSAKAGTGQFVLTCFASGKVAGKRKFYYTYS